MIMKSWEIMYLTFSLFYIVKIYKKIGFSKKDLLFLHLPYSGYVLIRLIDIFL